MSKVCRSTCRIVFLKTAGPERWKAWSKAVKDAVEGGGPKTRTRSFKQLCASTVEIHWTLPVSLSTINRLIRRARIMCPPLKIQRNGICQWQSASRLGPKIKNRTNRGNKRRPDQGNKCKRKNHGSLRKKPARAEDEMRKKPATGDEMSESDQTLGVKEDPDEANACLKHRTGFTPESDNVEVTIGSVGWVLMKARHPIEVAMRA